MFESPVYRQLIAAVLLGGLPLSAAAESFDVVLGGRVIGQLETGPGQLSSSLNNTPLGAADGWFRATVSGGGYSALNSEGRAIAVRFSDGQVQETTVTPESERTDLSDPAAVPAGVLDPITGLDRVVSATDCPAAFRMYDGRRAMLIQPTAREVDGSELVCWMSYTVTHGPGHVSPFRLKRLRMEARYALADGQTAGINALRISAGPFAVELRRK